MRINLILFLLLPALAWPAENLHQRYFSGVFSGDLSFMPGLAESATSTDPLYARFQDRFMDRTEPEIWQSLDDPLALKALQHYRDYWVDSLLEPGSHDARKEQLAADLDALLMEYKVTARGEDAFERLESALHDRGHGFLGGRTPPLQEYMLWRETRSETFEVELTDGIQPVTVHFIDDFVSLGWANFATFGRAGTGGWAKDDGLYCISEHYPDLQSEEFTVEYLRHEARHYADYELFPGLPAADLEYRGKLTQLIFAQTDQAIYLKEFNSHGAAASEAPHPLANWHVLNNLARMLGADTWQDSLISEHDRDTIAATARALLAENTRLLSDAEQDVAAGLIHPVRQDDLALGN